MKTNVKVTSLQFFHVSSICLIFISKSSKLPSCSVVELSLFFHRAGLQKHSALYYSWVRSDVFSGYLQFCSRALRSERRALRFKKLTCLCVQQFNCDTVNHAVALFALILSNAAIQLN